MDLWSCGPGEDVVVAASILVSFGTFGHCCGDQRWQEHELLILAPIYQSACHPYLQVEEIGTQSTPRLSLTLHRGAGRKV